MQHDRLAAVTLATASATMMVAGAAAQTAPPAAERPAALRELDACRTIADPGQRLACFDRTAAAIDEGARTGQIVVVDREQLREARRGLFGFSLPSLRLFARDRTAPDEELKEIKSTVARSYRDAAGATVIVLAEGAKWRQDDDRHTGSIGSGAAIIIRRGALGAYFASIAGRPGFKVKREN